MALFKCKMCGGNLEVTEGMTVCECEYCGTKQTVPKTRDDVMSNVFNRANNLRIKCEFDKAQEIYDKIVASDPSESEAYWGIVLCKYGIEYVEDPATYKKVPTCHRTQLESVMTDVDFLAAVEHADVVQRSVYEEEARAIDKLQKDILEIVHKEQPFDVFICYKETDESGKRTNDSVIANDIYHQLTTEGFKVFYAAITLEDKLGQEYEPYIFAALNSAKVMLVIGSKPEYFNAVWVKNEWSRYMKLMKSDRSKLLIPCYKDMDAYDLPEDFSHLQAQDMSKIGFINDVIRGIKKVIVKDEPVAKAAPAQTVVAAPASANVENLLKRGMLSLEDGKWDEADKFFEQVLNENVEEPRAYFGKMLSSLKARSEEHLLHSAPTKYSPLTDNEHYKKAVRFAGEEYKAYLLDLNTRYVYSSGMNIFNSARKKEEFLAAKDIFDKIPDYQPAKEKSAECTEKAHEIVYNNACNILFGKSDKSQLEFAMREFGRLSDYKDSKQKKAECEERIKEIDYALAMQNFDSAKGNDDFVTAESKFLEAKKIFDTLGDYSNAMEMSAECSKRAVESVYALGMEVFNSAKTERNYLAAKDIFDRIADYQPAKEKSAECDKRIEQIHDAEKESQYQTALSILTSDSSNEDELNNAISLFSQIIDWKDSEKRISECQERIEKIQAENERRRVMEQQEAERQRRIAEQREKARRKKRKIITVTTGSVVLVTGFLVLLFNAIIPNLKYNNALSLMNEGKYTEAITAFDALDGYNNSAYRVKECKYKNAVSLMSEGKYDEAITIFTELNDFKDSANQISECHYLTAVSLMNEGKYDEAISTFTELNGYKDSPDQITSCQNLIKSNHYSIAVSLMNNGKYAEAMELFKTLIGFENSLELWKECLNTMYPNNVISAGDLHTVGLKEDGRVVAVGENSYQQCNVSEWKDIVAVSAGYEHTVGLKSDGTVVAEGLNDDKQCNVSEWKDIVAVSAGKYHTVGLKSDGTVVATGYNDHKQCNVSEWKDIIAVSAGFKHTVGLKADGTVVATGYNKYGQCNISEWKDIVAVSAGSYHTVGLKSDGTVVAIGSYTEHACFVSSWRDIIAVSAGSEHTVGLKSDGTVVSTGYNIDGRCDVSDWTDVVAVSGGSNHTVGLKADGTVVATGGNAYGKCNVSEWKIKTIND